MRLLDTRTNGETLGANANLNLQVAGIGEVPADATAIVVNVTATDTTAPSFLTVYPTGETLRLSSNLNWSPGDTVANVAIIPVGSGGDLTFFNANGRVDVIVDLQGYFVGSGSSGGDYVPLSPQRITDTRAGSGYPNASQTLGARSTLNIQVGGAGGVPSEGASAVVLNVTVTDTTAYSFLAVYPGGERNPGTSALNWASGATVVNRVVVPLSSARQITVYNASGDADVVVDVSGYFTAGASSAAAASLYYPISPTRMLDTRVDANELGASSYLGAQFAGVDGISSQATAIVANLTGTDTSSASYYTLSPQETTPMTSDLNWLHGVTVANLDIATLNSDGDAYLYNSHGSADAIIDVFGYFVPVSGTNAPAIQPCSSIILSSTGPTVSGGPVDVTSRASCPSGESVQYTYWYLAPGASVWSLEGASSANASFQYSTTGWADGPYQLMAWASSQAGIYQGVLSTLTPTPPPTPTPMPTQPPIPTGPFLSALASGSSNSTLRASGFNQLVISASWAEIEPNEGSYSASATTALQSQINAAMSTGLQPVLDPGTQYAPSWIFTVGGGTQFIDQFGDVFSGSASSGNDVANAVTDMAVRAQLGHYIAYLGSHLTGVTAVRVGGLAYGELRYPSGQSGSQANAYWFYDASSQATLPSSVQGWKPGTGKVAQATAFLAAYNAAMVNYGLWIEQTAASAFPSQTRLEIMLGGWGERPGDVTAAESGLLVDTPDNVNMGLDWTDLLSQLADSSRIVAYSTYADATQGGSSNPDPAAYIHSILPAGMAEAGESTGNGQTTAAGLALMFQDARTWGWYSTTWNFTGQPQTPAQVDSASLSG